MCWEKLLEQHESADKSGGIALITIKMPDLDGEQNEMDGDSLRKYLKACKSAKYVRVDGCPGLILHCHFWTAIIITPFVVRTKLDYTRVHVFGIFGFCFSEYLEK